MSIFTDILTGGSNNHETTSEAANALATDLLTESVVGSVTSTSGVAPMTGAFAVNAQSPAAMAVDVSTGVAYVTATPSSQTSQLLRVRNTATAEVTISANSTGSTRYDWIYLSVSAANAANPNADGDNVTTLVASRSTSSASDDGTPPTYGLLLAVVTVANGASSIANGSISDRRTAGLLSSGVIADAAVLPKHLVTGTGTSWAWQPWTPTLTNVTVGNGTINYADYIEVGQTVICRFKFTLGSTSAVSGTPSISLPETPHADYVDADPVPSLTRLAESGSNAHIGVCSIDQTNDALFINRQAVSGSNIVIASVSSTTPFTWGTSDVIATSFVYEKAA